MLIAMKIIFEVVFQGVDGLKNQLQGAKMVGWEKRQPCGLTEEMTDCATKAF